MKVLITGVAGFIGYHLCKQMITKGCTVIGIDNINSYYDEKLKLDRLNDLGIKILNGEISSTKKFTAKNLTVLIQDITHRPSLSHLFEREQFDTVINLAAQAGVRYSIENPKEYIQSNVVGFFNIVDLCKIHKIQTLMYASSSSVYGNQRSIPYRVGDKTGQPISLYAATKGCNELIAHSYSHLYKLRCIGLRFFTVYGPWGRPDMAYYKFADQIKDGTEIQVYNNGNLTRDFTYIDDVVTSIYKLYENRNSFTNDINAEIKLNSIFNIGSSLPIFLKDFINILETELKMGKAKRKYIGMQPGDVNQTYSDSEPLFNAIDYRPSTSLATGIHNFVLWYKEYYNIK